MRDRQHEIRHVSDTALWVAMYRAQEQQRAHPAFSDPLARKLAGARGEAIASHMPFARGMQFALAVRTAAIDRLLREEIECGVDAVLNLGAGLDTRPWRMALPKALHWIEVDFPQLIDYKRRTLGRQRASCNVEYHPADLCDPAQRRALFDQIEARFASVLVLTEGLIPYFTTQQARDLSTDLLHLRPLRRWILDYRRGNYNIEHENAIAARLKNAPFRFGESNMVAFFIALGWWVERDVGIMDEAHRIGRTPGTLPDLVRSLTNRTYGYAVLKPRT